MNLKNYKQFYNFREYIAPGGGEDETEAVLDGIEKVCSLAWNENENNFLFHFLDAPPHGKIFHQNNSSAKNTKFDKYNEGCPCKQDYETLLLKLREKNMNYTIIKFSDSVDTMINKFSNYINIDITDAEADIEDICVQI